MKSILEEKLTRQVRQREKAERAMTVEELCILLQQYPKELPVVVNTDFVEKIRIIEEFPLGDPASPYGCEWCKVLEIV